MAKSPTSTSRNGASRASKAAAKGPVTLDMVARAAGVSSATVSRILNGTAVVSEAKRAVVDAAVLRLGYVPNPVARGLAGGKSFSVGVITQTLDSPFYGGAMRGIEDELARVGYSPLFVSGHWSAAREAKLVAALRSRRVDGLIILTGRMKDAALIELAREMPVVITGRTLQAPGLVSLHFDNVAGARLATEHLLGLGHARIACITGDLKHPDGRDRLRGFRSAMAAAGRHVDPDLVVPGSFTEESGRLAMERLIAAGRPFSAVFSSNDQMAFGAALALHRAGLRVPQDVSLVGFDDLAGAHYAIPPLTTVHHPVEELGQIAARAMLKLIAGQSVVIQLPSPRLMLRESTQVPPAPARSGS